MHLMVNRVIDRTTMLDSLSEPACPSPPPSRGDEIHHPQRPRAEAGRRHGHPRDVRILPKSRDFH